MRDINQQLIDQVKSAHDQGRPLNICGGNSKVFLGRRSASIENADIIDVSEHRGILEYNPVELVMTARAGTPLVDIEQALAEHQQVLSFQPPTFAGAATLGGTLAANLSGPTRPWSGSIRDMVLGAKIINGQGELLNFGGQVMKNVAGYDLARAQAGAMGALGLISQVSLKVLPKAEMEQTLSLQVTENEAIILMNQLAGSVKPIMSACWFQGRLKVRLSGAANSVEQSVRQWCVEYGFTVDEQGDVFWQQLKEYQLPFFIQQLAQPEQVLWRFSIKSSAPALPTGGETLIDWGGAQRWLINPSLDTDELQQLAQQAGGSVAKWRGGQRDLEVNHPLPQAMQALQQRLMRSLDSKNILNPGRLYEWL